MEVSAGKDETYTRKIRSVLWRVLDNQAVLGYLLVAPLLLIMLGLLAYPVANAVLISFQRKLLGQPGQFIGLANYRELLLRDPHFLRVIRNTLIFTFGSVFAKLVIGMGMALILNQRMRLRNIFRGWLLLPWVTPAFVTALTGRWMFDFTTGVINFVLVKLHVIQAPIPWLANPATALFAVTATSVWRGFPFYGVTFLAAMQAVQVQLYEAAEVDGATAWDKFRHVTIPGIRTVVLIVVMLSTIWTMNDFATVFIMTGGGPGYATHTIPTYAYQLGFMTSRFGYAVAVSMISVPLFIVIILALSPLIMRGEDE